jgi:hypothetical protein
VVSKTKILPFSILQQYIVCNTKIMVTEMYFKIQIQHYHFVPQNLHIVQVTIAIKITKVNMCVLLIRRD